MNTKKEITALVTGGTRGVGKAVCLQIAKEGVQKLFINYLEKEDPANELSTQLKTKGLAIHLLKYNLAYAENVKAMFNDVRLYTQHLDYFVHCPALTAFKPLHKVRANQWDLTMNVSTRSFLLCVQGCIPLMQNGGGAVVAISSTGSRRFNPNYGALGVSKMALETMVRYLAVELAEKNIRVNGITSGLLKGETMPPFPEIERVVEETLRRTPAGRLGNPDEIARAVCFILRRANWMYGQNLVLDGGFCLT